GEFRGTLGYMPPEQMDDAKRAGPAADVFALGAILYEMLAGQRAFQGSTTMEIVGNVANGRVTPLARARPDVAPWLAAVVERALSPDPRARQQDANELARALRGARPALRLAFWLPVAAGIVAA